MLTAALVIGGLSLMLVISAAISAVTGRLGLFIVSSSMLLGGALFFVLGAVFPEVKLVAAPLSVAVAVFARRAGARSKEESRLEA